MVETTHMHNTYNIIVLWLAWDCSEYVVTSVALSNSSYSAQLTMYNVIALKMDNTNSNAHSINHNNNYYNNHNTTNLVLIF